MNRKYEPITLKVIALVTRFGEVRERLIDKLSSDKGAVETATTTGRNHLSDTPVS